MKQFFLVLVVGGGLMISGDTCRAQAERKLELVDEKLDQLRAEVEALQFRQQKLEEKLEAVGEQVAQLRQTGRGASDAELKAIEEKIHAVDAAREKDKQVILDTLSKEMASMVSSAPVVAGSNTHEVKTGETLGAISRIYGVTVADLMRVNNLSNPNTIQVGQKLAIPK